MIIILWLVIAWIEFLILQRMSGEKYKSLIFLLFIIGMPVFTVVIVSMFVFNVFVGRNKK